MVGTADSQALGVGLGVMRWACELWASELVRGVDGGMARGDAMLGVVGACVVVWGGGPARGVGSTRLVGLLCGFVGGMAWVMLAGDVVLLFVGWECIGVVSVLLVGWATSRSHAWLAGLKACV